MSKPAHPGFLVWNPCGYQPRFVHATAQEAKTEAKRLARAHPGQAFYVLVPVGAALVPDSEPSFHTIDPLPTAPVDLADDEIPF